MHTRKLKSMLIFVSGIAAFIT